MRNLKSQLLMSHLALVALMVAVMAGAVLTFHSLGRSIDRIVKNNSRSVMAAQEMKESVEQLNGAALLFVAGETGQAREQSARARTRFHEAFRIEANNITEAGEQEISDHVERWFADYAAACDTLLLADPPLPRKEAGALFLERLDPAHTRLNDRIDGIVKLNQTAILRADLLAKSQAQQASLVGVGVTLGALLIAVLFSMRAVHLALRPLRSLARQAEEIGAGRLEQKIDIDRTDEIGALAASFNEMATRLREVWRLEEERLHRAERMSDAALESLYDPVIVTDAAGRIAHLNRAAEGLFGPAQAAQGRSVASLTKNEHIASAVTRALGAEGESPSPPDDQSAKLVPIDVASAQRVYMLRVTAMRDDDRSLLGAAAVLEDVTHLHDLDRLKTEFISVASHELRTPVTSLLLSVQLLQEGACGELNAAQLEVIQAQREDLERLEQMMRDLLDVTRLETGAIPPRLEIVAVGDMVEAAIDSIRPRADAGGVSVHVAIPHGLPPARADRRQIVRMVVNLLNNAVRHTPAGGSVTVRAAQHEKEADRLTISVTDTGSGIPAKFVPRIFDRFVQVPGATRGGSGLGLCIARTIVEAHGGEIWVDSTEGVGSTFTFTLPAVSSSGDDPCSDSHTEES